VLSCEGLTGIVKDFRLNTWVDSDPRRSNCNSWWDRLSTMLWPVVKHGCPPGKICVIFDTKC